MAEACFIVTGVDVKGIFHIVAWAEAAFSMSRNV